jgi:hypothetical protein
MSGVQLQVYPKVTLNTVGSLVIAACNQSLRVADVVAQIRRSGMRAYAVVRLSCTA